MRVRIDIKATDPHRHEVRTDAEWWLGNRARSGWRIEEEEDEDGAITLTIEFTDPMDAVDFHNRLVGYEHRGRIL